MTIFTYFTKLVKKKRTNAVGAKKSMIQINSKPKLEDCVLSRHPNISSVKRPCKCRSANVIFLIQTRGNERFQKDRSSRNQLAIESGRFDKYLSLEKQKTKHYYERNRLNKINFQIVKSPNREKNKFRPDRQTLRENIHPLTSTMRYECKSRRENTQPRTSTPIKIF